MHSRLLGLAFFFVFSFARSPTDAKPQTHCLAGVACGVRIATRSAVSLQLQAILTCRSCMRLQMSCIDVFTAQLAL